VICAHAHSSAYERSDASPAARGSMQTHPPL
jgi:hypothetical protein